MEPPWRWETLDEGRPLLMSHLAREEVRELAPRCLLVLPIGATEQHGPHLPLGTDAMLVEHVARAAAERARERVPALVAPTLPFGSSHHHLPFGGTLSLSTETCYRALREVLESAISSGFGTIFVLNGHGGNEELMTLAARDLALAHHAAIAAASYWTVARQRLAEARAHNAYGLPGHAGEFETSLVLALRPELVREPRPDREGRAGVSAMPYRVEASGFWQGIDGYTDSPARATAESGRAYVEAIVEAVAEAFVGFYREHQERSGAG